VAGMLLLLTGYSFFDPLIAGAVALWIIVTTAREVFSSQDELIWPERIVCCHTAHDLDMPHQSQQN
jgi:Co/Zn/Cd efflux system component